MNVIKQLSYDYCKDILHEASVVRLLDSWLIANTINTKTCTLSHQPHCQDNGKIYAVEQIENMILDFFKPR